MTQTASNVKRALSISFLTLETLTHLAEIMTGNKYDSLYFTEEGAAAIEHLAYVANIGAESKAAAWERFRELCASSHCAAEIPEEVKEAVNPTTPQEKVIEEGVSRITFTTEPEKGCVVTCSELMGNRWVTLWTETWAKESEALEEYGYEEAIA